jgi:DNA polymerase-1
LWPNLPWTGDIKADKAIAAGNYPEWDPVPGHDYRFQSKRIQHGSNYGLSPYGISMIAHIPVKAAREAQDRYFETFPEIRDWQNWTKERVLAGLPLVNPVGRTVRLFGRPDDGHTYKQGLAFPPQSGVGDVLNLGLWRLWRHCDAAEPQLIQLLAQVHDAVLGQFREDETSQALALAALKHHMRVDTPVTDYRGTTRSCVIAVETAVGMNWGKAGPGNVLGIVEVK